MSLPNMINELIQSELEPFLERLFEGGAFGHLAHPFEDLDMTFGQMKKMVDGILSGKAVAYEKIDGQQISFSWKGGRVVAARNKSHLKNFGEAALTSDTIKGFIGKSGNVPVPVINAFYQCIVDLDNALGRVPKNILQRMFQEGKFFMNAEVVANETANIVPYYKDYVVFHGLIEYDQNGNQAGEQMREPGQQLEAALKAVGAESQSKFVLKAANQVSLKNFRDIPEKRNELIADLKQLQGKMPDSSTLGQQQEVWWKAFILKQAQTMGYKISPEVLTMLVGRWGRLEKGANTIPKITSKIDNDQFKRWVVEYDSNEHQQQYDKNLLPYEMFFLRLGAEVLANASGFLSAAPDKAVADLAKGIQRDAEKIKDSRDVNDLRKLKYEMERLEKIGRQNIAGTEGIVYSVGGKLYKLTGLFTPVHRILSILKYKKPTTQPVTEGGWLKPQLTGQTKITPEVVKKTLRKFEEFLTEFNSYLADHNIPPVSDYTILGSAQYYKQDSPDAVYGDLDMMVSVPGAEESEAATKAKYGKMITDFINTGKVPFVDEESAIRSKGNQLIFNVVGDEWVQVDMLFTIDKYKDWFSTRFSPERGLKGFTIGALYFSLANALTMSISDRGVRAKLQGGKLAPSNIRKNVIDRLISIDPKNFLMDIAKFMSEYTGTPLKSVDALLSSHPGVNKENINLTDFAKGILGLVKTMETNGILQKLGFTNAHDFTNKIKATFVDKLKEKYEKSEKKATDPDTQAALHKLQVHANRAKDAVFSIIKEGIIREGGNVVFANSSLENQYLDATVKNAIKIWGLSGVPFELVGSKNKPVMNDIDVAIDSTDLGKKIGAKPVDRETYWAKADAFFKSHTPKEVDGTPAYKLNKGLDQIHISAPIVGKDGSFVQIDLMLGDVGWMRDALSGALDSKYKAVYRNQLLAAILAHSHEPTKDPNVMKKYQINWKKGLQSVDIITKGGKIEKANLQPVAANMNAVAEFLFGPGKTFQDINTFEKLFKLVNSPSFRYKAKKDEIIKSFNDDLVRMKLPPVEI